MANADQVFKLETPNAICKVFTKYDPATDQFSAVYRFMNRQGQLLKEGRFHIAMAPIRRDVMKVLSNSTGWSLKGAFKSATKLGSKVATMRTLRNIKRIMEDPRFVAAATVVYPPLGVNIALMKKGSALIDAARAGDPRAAAKLASINVKAYQGDANAIQVRKALRAMYMAKSMGVNVDAKIEGWLYNRTYRDPSQVSSSFRQLYTDGLAKEKTVKKVDLRSLFKK